MLIENFAQALVVSLMQGCHLRMIKAFGDCRTIEFARINQTPPNDGVIVFQP
jgi:hypothetical protein